MKNFDNIQSCAPELLYYMEYIVECLQDNISDTFLLENKFILNTCKQGYALLVFWNEPQNIIEFTLSEVYQLWDLLLKKIVTSHNT